MNRQNWFEVNGDETLALDWPLNEYSLVWEIGGFEGRWAQQIWDKFHCYIEIFEPQLWACKKLMDRFHGNPAVSVHPYGIWVSDSVLPIGNYHTDGASLVYDDGREPTQLGAFLDIKKVLDPEIYHRPVDLALMNIEGGEYPLMTEMITCKDHIISRFTNVWVQFHPKDELDEVRYQWICEAMKSTHEMIWDCYPTAVAWRCK